MSRKAAREVAIHIVYDFGFNNEIGSESLNYFLSDDFAKSVSDDTEIYSQVGVSQHAYITDIVNGVSENRDEIDELIKKIFCWLESQQNFENCNGYNASCNL